jgi:hypothetical protein
MGEKLNLEAAHSGNDSVMIEHGTGARWEEDRGRRKSRRVEPRVVYNSVVAVIVVAAPISIGGKG